MACNQYTVEINLTFKDKKAALGFYLQKVEGDTKLTHNARRFKQQMNGVQW